MHLVAISWVRLKKVTTLVTEEIYKYSILHENMKGLNHISPPRWSNSCGKIAFRRQTKHVTFSCFNDIQLNVHNDVDKLLLFLNCLTEEFKCLLLSYIARKIHGVGVSTELATHLPISHLVRESHH